MPEDGEILAAVRGGGGPGDGDRGVDTNSTAQSVEIAEQAARVGADGLLVTRPAVSCGR